MKRKINVERFEDLNDAEKIAIQHVINILFERDVCKDNVLEAVNNEKYRDAERLMQKLNILNDRFTFKDAKQMVIQYSRVETLEKILNQELFNKSRWSEGVIIPIEVLPEYSSSNQFQQCEKSHIYKRLGATIICKS